MSVAFMRSAVSYRCRPTASKESREERRTRSNCDATRRLPSKSGQRRPFEHPFPASRDCRRENYRRDTHATETVARERKEGRDESADERATCASDAVVPHADTP